jgi:SAM-dependent methyltransferase
MVLADEKAERKDRYTPLMTTFDELQRAYWNKPKHRTRKDPTHPLIKTYVESKLALLPELFGSMPTGIKSLDVGAGNGYFSYYLEKMGSATAVDYSSVILDQNPVADKRVMDARKLEFADNTFDLSFCHAVLHHIDAKDRVQVVKEMARVSKGAVMIVEPNVINPVMAAFGLLKKAEWGSLCFTRGYVRGLAEQAGLEVVCAVSWGALTPNRMPIPASMLKFMQKLERPILFGVTNIVLARKR